MITAGLGFETAVAGRSGCAVGRYPVPELRSRADKMSPRITRNCILIFPFALHHHAHRKLLRELPELRQPRPFPRRDRAADSVGVLADRVTLCPLRYIQFLTKLENFFPNFVVLR